MAVLHLLQLPSWTACPRELQASHAECLLQCALDSSTLRTSSVSWIFESGVVDALAAELLQAWSPLAPNSQSYACAHAVADPRHTWCQLPAWANSILIETPH